MTGPADDSSCVADPTHARLYLAPGDRIDTRPLPQDIQPAIPQPVRLLSKASSLMDYLRKQVCTALWLVFLGAGTVASISCGSDPASLSIEGTILVAATTVGTDFDPDGYTVSVNNTQSGVLGNLDTIYVNNLQTGSYQVRLAGIAANCSTGANPLTVAVVPADTVNAEFAVTCDVPEPPGGGGPPP